MSFTALFQALWHKAVAQQDQALVVLATKSTAKSTRTSMSAAPSQWRMQDATQAEANSTSATSHSRIWMADIRCLVKYSKGMEFVDAFKGRDKMEKVEVVEV